MRSEDLARLKEWFSAYTGSFLKPEHREAVSLKVEHTRMVCENILAIARGENCASEEKLRLAEAVALLHDVGRFPQFKRYGTFDDRVSTNHGRLGAEVLVREKALDSLTGEERKLILDAVRFHNAPRLPASDSDTLFFLKLIRDADKLDIWRVMLEIYEYGRKSSAVLGLPDSPECSRELISAIRERRIGMMSHVRTINDLKLVHLSWVFDLNFPTTHRLLAGRGYLKRMAATLPQTEEMREAISAVEAFERGKLEAV